MNAVGGVSRNEGLNLRLLLGALGVALVLQAICAVSFVGALHRPTPHRVPVALVAPGDVAAALSARIDAAGDAIKPVVVADERALRHAIDERKVYGGVVVGAGGVRLVVADAAGVGAALVLERIVSQFAAAQGARVAVTHVKRLPDGDPRGVSAFYVIVALIFGGYFGATVLSVIRGTSSRSRRLAAGRIVLIAAYAVASGLLAALVADPLFGALQGNFAGLAAIAALVVLATGAATAALQAVLGFVGTGIALVSFVLIGNPSTGGPVTHEFLPGFWRVLGPYLPGGAGYEAILNTIYFDGAALTRPLLVLAAYAVIGATVCYAVGWRRSLIRVEDAELELATAAGAL